MNPKYRPDIDGLRAVAILPVILFHAGLGCPGGYVGVDVFFVISGFLITSLLLKEMAEGAFSLAGFWERRIRRIFPAMLVMVAATFGAGWFFYTPEDFSWLGQSIAAQAMLLSNVYFWLKLDYFGGSADTKPLLHTWSLAVEEQFYVLFPLFLWWLARRRGGSLSRTIAWLGLGSLAWSVAGSYTSPQADFYLLPSRAWELMAGAWLATGPNRSPAGDRWNELLGVAGLGLILYAVCFYTRDTRFPGLAALAPCLGAAAVIYSGGGQPTLAGRLLAWRPVVFTGWISYSLYLWHWPLLVFAKYGSLEVPGWGYRLGVLLVAAALAAASWKWIETPFRRRLILPRRSQVFAFAGIWILILVLCGGGVYWRHGLPARLPAAAAELVKDFRNQPFQNEITPAQAAGGQFAELGAQNPNQPVEILLWGDSHAMPIAVVLDELCRQHGVRGMEATHFCMAPLLGYMTTDGGSAEEQPAFAKATVQFIAQRQVKKVILAAKWSLYGPPDREEACLVETIHVLQAAGASVYVLKDVPGAAFEVPAAAMTKLLHQGSLDRLSTPAEQYQAHQQVFEPVFNRLARIGATILDTPAYFLNAQGGYDVVRQGRLLYTDDQHLTVAGAELLRPMLEPLFSRKAGGRLSQGGN